MKLRNIYIVCKENYNIIKDFVGTNTVINGRTGISIKDWKKTSEAANRLKEIPAIKEKVNSFLNSIPSLCRRADDPDILDVTNHEWTIINSEKAHLVSAIETIIELYESMGLGEEKGYGIDIKLPSINDFSEYVQCISDIDFIFSKCPFLKDENEKLKFENFDVGSMWLTFTVIGIIVETGSAILNNLQIFIDQSIILRTHYLDYQKQKFELEKIKQDEEYKKTILQYIDTMYKKEVDKCIKELEMTTAYKVENNDGDENGRIKQCFEKMGKLIEQGLQIYSTIDSPKETQVLFEPLKTKYMFAEEQLKLIEEKKKEAED